VPALESWSPPNTTEALFLIYNEGLGAEPPAESRGRAPGQGSGVRGGVAPPEVESFLALECPTKAAKFAVGPYWLYLANCAMRIYEQDSVA